MKTIYQNNVEVIKERNWDYLLQNLSDNTVPCIESKTKVPTLKYKDCYIHSPYDPEKEAKRLLNQQFEKDPSIIFVFGLGYGYHISALLKKNQNSDCVIFIFEISPDIFNSSLHYANLSFLRDQRVFLFVGEDFWSYFQTYISAIPVSRIKNTVNIYLQSEYSLYKKEYDLLLSNINELLQFHFQNQLTSLEFEKLWLKNLILNSRHFHKHHDISLLYNKLQSYPAVIVSAGPSLAYSLDELKQFQDQVFILSTDTALSALLEKDITPDFVIAVDCQYHNFKDFITLDKNHKITLLYDLMVYPKIPKWIKGEHFFFTSLSPTSLQNSFLGWLQKQLKLDITSFVSGSSVATSCIEIAQYLGLNPIILIGQDLSYSYLMSHSRSTPIYNHFLYNHTHRLKTLEDHFFRIIKSRNPFKIPNFPNTFTDFILNNLRKWLGAYVKIQSQEKNAKTIINATPTGLPIENVPNADLKQCLNETLKNYLIKNDKKNSLNLNRKKKIQFNKLELEQIYSSFYHGVERFFNLLLKELDHDIIFEENILIAKKNLELEFPFLKLVFQKDDLWYYRKEKISDKDKCLYVNALVSTSMSILKSINRFFKYNS